MSKPNIPEGGFKHTMLDPQFGKLVPDDFPDERDAIHIATAAVFAETDLEPGDHVGLTTSAPDVMGKSEIAPLGIVDPFLTETVKKGQRFWVFLYPGTIRSLRHNWSHPAFDKKAALVEALKDSPSKRRMRAFAASLSGDTDYDGNPYPDVTLDELLERTKDYVQNKKYWSEGPRFEDQSLYPEFWVDFEILTGIKVPENDQYSFFSCSC